MKRWMIPTPLLFVLAPVGSEQIPQKGPDDLRVRYADYKATEVTTVAVSLGVVTRIILNDDEIIQDSAPGFPSKCDSVFDEWCIKAEAGTRQIWIKPKPGATYNNIEVQTSKRDYSLRLEVRPGAEKSRSVYYRVIYRYPLPQMPSMNVRIKELDKSDQSEDKKEDSVQDFAEPIVRNARYSRQVTPGSEDIAPTVVFDDGRFTYFRFPKNREVPTVFAIGPTGEEIRINTHSERLSIDPENSSARVSNDYMVAQRVSKKFILRLGSAVVNIINDDFDVNGIETYNGTTTPKMVREKK